MSTTRRDFLKATLGTSAVLTLGSPVPAFLSQSALAEARRQKESQTALVVVQLSGGNDGLNTVVPFEDDAYARGRPTLRLPPGSLHKIDSHLGLHREMKALYELYQEGNLSIVQGVGYPNSSRDHDAAMRDWQTARPTEPLCPTGWVGRATDFARGPEDPTVPGLFVGDIPQVFSLNAERCVVPALRSADQYVLKGPPAQMAARKRLAESARSREGRPENPLLSFLNRSTLAATACSEKLEPLARELAAGAGDYPKFPLAQTLRLVAQLVRADVGVRVYFTEMGGGGIGGFDTHANQAANHGALLRQLSESVAAFVRDLRKDKLLDRVLLMTFSEFGRTVAENGRRGTDHGAAQPLLLAGGKLKKRLVGENPSLTDLDQGAQKVHTDFRRVYATALESWLGLESEPILGDRFEPLDLLKPVG